MRMFPLTPRQMIEREQEERRIEARKRALAEIQAGPNPLSPSEIEGLIDRDPLRYGMFRDAALHTRSE